MLFTQPREGRRYLLARGTPGSSKNKHSLISAPLQLLPKRISGKRRKVLFREHQSYQAAEKLATTSLSPAATSSFWKSASVTISFTFPAAPFLFLDLLAMTVPVELLQRKRVNCCYSALLRMRRHFVVSINDHALAGSLRRAFKRFAAR